MDLFEGLEFEDFIPMIAIGAVQASKPVKAPIRTGQSGHKYIEELLSSNPKRIYEVLRMKKDTFYDLCGWLKEHTALRSTWRTSLEEQVIMFLWTVNFSASNRQVCERF
jgi:hypothetical protein